MDLRLGRGESEGTPWSVLADIAITIVLVLVVLINTELARWQHDIKKAIQTASRPEWIISVDSLSPDRQRITFSSEALFETCRAALKPAGIEVLRTVAVIGGKSGYLESVQVEGHTDRNPIRSFRGECPFASNWELSSARATRVVTLFSTDSLIENIKLSAVGRAEFHPVDSVNLDPNRRIELILQFDRTRVLAAVIGNRDKRDTTASTGVQNSSP
jgi:flagellar motor protein MotB